MMKINYLLFLFLFISCSVEQQKSSGELNEFFTVDAPEKFNLSDMEKIKTVPVTTEVKNLWTKKYSIPSENFVDHFELYPIFKKNENSYALYVYNIRNDSLNINYYEYMTVSKKDGNVISKGLLADLSRLTGQNFAECRFENNTFFVKQSYALQSDDTYEMRAYEISFDKDGIETFKETARGSGNNYFESNNDKNTINDLSPESHALHYLAGFFKPVPENKILGDKELNIDPNRTLTMGLEIFSEIQKRVSTETKEENLTIYPLYYYEDKMSNSVINFIYFESPAITYQIYAVFHKKKENENKYKITDYLLVGGTNDANGTVISNVKINFNKNEISFDFNNDPMNDAPAVRETYQIDFTKSKFVKK